MRTNSKNHYLLIPLLFLQIFLVPSSGLLAEEFLNVSPEEALFVRRILEFWRDKDNVIVKSQIDQFLHQYPQSEYKDSLLVILGDISWQEKNFESALKNYQRITKSQYKEKVFNNCLDCQYHLGRFQEIADTLLSRISAEDLNSPDEQRTLWTYYLAEALLNLSKAHPEQGTEKLEQSKTFFEQLLHTQHKTNAKLGLAEIEFLKGNAEQVVQHYLDLAQDNPEKQDEMLLRAAQLQAQYDPEIALAELGRIQDLYGEFSSQAALSRLGILFDLGRHQQIIDEKPEFFKALKASQHPILYLYVGRSHFHLNQYEEALGQFLLLQKPENRLPNDDPYVEKNLLVMMSVCANRLHQLELAIQLRKKFQDQFSQDPALAELLYYEAMTYAHYQKYPEAIENFNVILMQYPENDFYDDALYEKSYALYKLEKWKESREGFAKLIQNKTEAKLYRPAVQYMPYLALQMLENSENKGSADVQQLRLMLLEDLRRVLEYQNELDSLQAAKYSLQLGKVLYELKSYPEAVEALSDYLKKYPDDHNLYQGHLLLALCYHEGPKDPVKFAEHAERVLTLNPQFADQIPLRMNLFNAYIELAKNDQDKNTYYEQAAKHLYEALNDPKASIKQENQLWLANYFYQQIRSARPDYEIEPLEDAGLKTSAEKVLAIYAKILPAIEGVKFQTDNLFLEIEYFKMSNLYGWLNRLQDQKNILAALLKSQKGAPELKWQLRGRALFSFANVNLALNENKEALDNYHQLLSSKFSDSYIVNASKLKWARLAYISLPDAKKTTEDPEMLAILKILKDVQIHKLLLQEPIHLEAGMDYAYIRSSLEPLEKRDAQHLFLLKRLKEDFSGRDDLWSREYADSRLAHPDKNSLVEAYLMLMNGYINLLESKLADQQNTELKKEHLEMAGSLFQNLLTENSFSTKYLKHLAESGLQQMDFKG